MIEINLLPDEYKAQKSVTKHGIPVNLILICLNAFFVVVLLLITAVNLSRTITLGALKTRLDGLASEQQKIMDLERRTQNLNSTNQLFSPYVTNRFQWAKKLNKLSDLMIPGIWLRQLSIRTVAPDPMQDPSIFGGLTRSLKIEASVVSLSRDEMGSIGKLIRKLKRNEEFYGDFANIELEGVMRRKISSIEIMDFTLICLFKKEVRL